MAGAMFDVALDDSRTGQALARLAERLDSLRTPLLDVAEYLHQSTDARTRRQVAPDGTPWAPLSPVTLARKRSGGKILRETGALLDTLRHQVVGDELHFGTDRLYGAVQQLGQKKGASGAAGGRPIPWGDIPARPYLGLSTEDEAEVLAIIAEYLVEPLGVK